MPACRCGIKSAVARGRICWCIESPVSVVRHTAYNLAGAIVPIGVTLVTVPLYLTAIGMERYGVLALAWVLAGYFGFFDFGIGRATARKMATLSDAPPAARNRLFWTSALLTGGLALVASLLFWPVARLFLAHLEIPAALAPELDAALPWLVAAVPVGIVQSLLNGTLDGRRAFGIANVIGVAGNILTAVLPLASAWLFGPRLGLLIAATLIARLVVLAAHLLACRRVVPLGRPERGSKAAIADLARFGGWVTVSGIVSPLLVSFDRFAIGAWIGAAAVGHYVIGSNLIAQLQVVPAALARAIFPRFAALGKGSRDQADRAFGAMLAILTPMAVMAMILIEPFLAMWLGRGVATTSGPPTVLLLIGFWINSLAFLPFTRIQALDRPDLTGKVHLAELIPYALLLWWCVDHWGLMGAAAAWSIRVAADFVLLARLDGLKADQWRRLVPHAALVVGTAVSVLALPSGPTRWAALAVAGLSALALGWRTLPPELVDRFRPVPGGLGNA